MASIVMGLGGTGTDARIPECPCCYAYGGGGHGGLCPNAGKRPSQWVADPPAHIDRPYLPAGRHRPPPSGTVQDRPGLSGTVR